MGRHFLSIKVILMSFAVLAALLAAGCGDSANSADEANGVVTVQTGSLTKEKFIEKADRICEDSRAEFERKFSAFGQRSSSTANFIDRAKEAIDTVFVPIYEKQIDQISSLGAPSGDEEEVASILTSIQQSLDKAQQEPLQFFRENKPFPEAEKLARAYGLTGCADSFS